MSRKRIKQYLMLLTTAGIIAVVAQGSGTFASFSAETTNHGNLFQTGTLTLGNGINSDSSLCWSNDTGSTDNLNPTCGAVFTGSTDWQPGDSPSQAVITVQNGGTVDGTLSLYAPTIDSSGALSPTGAVCQSGAASVSGAVKAYSGTADLCTSGGLGIAIQEVDGPTLPANNLNDCLFPTDTVACDSTYSGTPKQLIQLPTDGSQLALGSLTASAKRYFLITVFYPASAGAGADNDYQARTARFDLTWHLTQT